MNLAYKREGYGVDAEKRNFYNRLVLDDKSSRYVHAWVEHWTGRVVVSASTEELAVRRHLYRDQGVMASESVGRVLARRMLECGIYHVQAERKLDEPSLRKKAFFSAIAESGIALDEPRRILEPHPYMERIDGFPAL